MGSLVRLYQAWNEIAPNGGQASKLQQWQRKLDEFEQRLKMENQPVGADP